VDRGQSVDDLPALSGAAGCVLLRAEFRPTIVKKSGSGIAATGKSEAGPAEHPDTYWLHLAREFLQIDRPRG
jgi:hypothetical protein